VSYIWRQTRYMGSVFRTKIKIS